MMMTAKNAIRKLARLDAMSWETAVPKIRQRIEYLVEMSGQIAECTTHRATVSPSDILEQQLRNISPVRLSYLLENQTGPVIIKAPILLTEGKICPSLLRRLGEAGMQVHDLADLLYISNAQLIGIPTKRLAEMSLETDIVGEPVTDVDAERIAKIKYKDVDRSDIWRIISSLQLTNTELQKRGLTPSGSMLFDHEAVGWQWCWLVPQALVVSQPYRKMVESIDFLIINDETNGQAVDQIDRDRLSSMMNDE